MEPSKFGHLEPIELRLHNLMGIAYSGHRVNTWCFSAATRHLYFSSAMHETQLIKFFRLGGCEEYAFGTAR